MPLWSACCRAWWAACYGEVRRITLPRTPVNKGKKSEGPSVETKRPQV
jgi:hypothetical protein